MKAIRLFRIPVTLLLLLTCNGCGEGDDSNLPSSRIPSDGRTSYNFVIVLTDDQRWDTLWAMPVVQNELVSRGITFTNAFTTSPVCCPFRASILSGGFLAQNTGVLTNGSLNGGMSHFNDADSLVTKLKGIGYATGFVGKYMHGYYPGYVPPGWTNFVSNNRGDMLLDWFNLEKITHAGETNIEKIENTFQYVTDFQKDQALNFIDNNWNSPFFLLLSTYAPHSPYIPAPGDEEGLFEDLSYQDRSYGEADLSDKPSWVRRAAADFTPCSSNIPRKQLRSLQAVDRAVGAVFESIKRKGILDRTVFIYTSDNGVTWGEHNIPCDKGMPYEEVVRVPLVLVFPDIGPRNDDHLVAANLDIPATIFDLTNIPANTDGLSLVPILRDATVSWRDQLLLEMYGYLDWRFQTSGIWAGLRTKGFGEEWKYVEHPTGEKELYDLINDPYEMESKHNDPSYQGIRDDLADRLRKVKGLAITVEQAPSGIVGEEYSLQLSAWGGNGSYYWSLLKGQLPDGLSMNEATGLISGIPTKEQVQTVSISVTDSSLARHRKEKKIFVRNFVFVTNSTFSAE